VRVVDVRVAVDGRRILAAHGRALRHVTIARPHARRFVVVVSERRSDGSTVTSTRRFDGCRESAPRVVLKRGRR
jgi:hypothetical protein